MKTYKKNIVIGIEISLLIISIIAFSYLAGEMEFIYEHGKNDINYEDKFSENISKAVAHILDFEILPSISAQELDDVRFLCCPKTTSGAICQDVPSTNPELCENGEAALSDTSCEFDSRCRTGCCIDDNFGTCTPQSTAEMCTGEKVRFVYENGGDASCNDLQIPDNACVKGCCILGDEAIFTTRQACYYRAGDRYNGDPFNSDIKSEVECLAKVESDEKAACVFVEEEGNRCRYISQRECVLNGGITYPGKLCTNQDLNTLCKMTQDTTCVDGRDEVYLLDSCGNLANIYDSSRVNDQSYWNEIVPKEESCGSGDKGGNSNSLTCGNCNRFIGSRCGESSSTQVSNICKNLNCESSEITGNIERKNGESWCVYESSIGNVIGPSGGELASDVVGSRHYKRICVNGEIKVEACQDWRGGICVESKMKDPNNEKEFTVAACKVNEAISCINYNFEGLSSTDNENKPSKSEAEEVQRIIAEKCLANKDCFLKSINVDEGFKFDMCVGKYPKGFDIKSQENDGSKLSDNLCSLGDQTCVAVFEKEIDGGWDCVYNCDCVDGSSPSGAKPSQKFINQMNELCVSLGDCGSYVNIEGEGTINSEAKTRKKVNVEWEDYAKYATPIPGQIAEPDSIEEILDSLGVASVTSEGEFISEEDKILSLIQIGGTISGALGTSIAAINFLTQATYALPGSSDLGILSDVVIGDPVVKQGLQTGALGGMSQFATYASGIGLGITVGTFIGKIFGLQGDALIVMAAAGAVAGAVVASMAVAAGQTIWAFCAAAIMVCLGAIIFLVLVALFLDWLGIGDTKEVNVEFSCYPWQAPAGGEKCELCQENQELYPCTEYRCESLGAACVLLNENTASPICIDSNPNDNVSPLISLGEVLDEDDEYDFRNEVEHQSVEIRNIDGNCIDEFTFVPFYLMTDEYAQCKYGLEDVQNFEEFGVYGRDGTRYSINHSFDIYMPSLDSLSAYDVTGDLSERFGNMNLYVKCSDQHGNFNLEAFIVNFCINEGPDLTAPRILSTIPRNGASLKYGVSEKDVLFYTNEPAQCKYDIENKEYDQMTTSMTCQTEVSEGSGRGFLCSTNFTNLQIGDNEFYVKCKDQPWLDDPAYTGEREGRQRNVNDGYSYLLRITNEELKIDSISPENGTQIVRGFSPYISIDLDVSTSGGADEGVSKCSYRLSNNRNFIDMFNTFSRNHVQNGLGFTEGRHEIEIRCEDSIGNEAYGKTTFNIKIDDTAPIVVRVLYRDGLEILTNEEAKCYYTNNRCDFTFDDENTQSMTNVISTKHNADWNSGVTYFIKCEDIYGNKNGECAMIVTPQDKN